MKPEQSIEINDARINTLLEKLKDESLSKRAKSRFNFEIKLLKEQNRKHKEKLKKS
jgi:hypothetical protein